MLNETKSHHPVPGRPFRVNRRLSGRSWKGMLTMVSVVNLIALAGVVRPAAAHQEDQLLANHAGQAGIECRTRLVPQEIGLGHFVLERITYCADVLRLEVTTFETLVEEPEAAIEAVDVLAAPTTDQLPSWSTSRDSRDRLSNRQYVRSLRELGRGVRRTSR